MPKVTLPSLASGFRSSNKLNEILEDIQDGLDNTLSRDGTSPNEMGAVLDMNSYRIINLGEPVDANDAIRLAEVEGLQEEIDAVEADIVDIEADIVTLGTEIDTVAADLVTNGNYLDDKIDDTAAFLQNQLNDHAADISDLQYKKQVHFFDFVDSSKWAGILARTNTDNLTTQLAAFHEYLRDNDAEGVLPSGLIHAHDWTMYDNVRVRGQGKSQTEIRSPAGSTGNMWKTANADALYAATDAVPIGSDPGLAGPTGWSYTGIYFNGADRAGSFGPKIFGWGFNITGCDFNNFAGYGCRSRCGLGGEATTTPFNNTFDDCSFQFNGQEGFIYEGPHDAKIVRCTSSRNSKSSAGSYDGISIRGGARFDGSSKWFLCHVWSTSAGRHRRAWDLQTFAQLIECEGEGAREAQVYINSNFNPKIHGGRYYAGNTVDGGVPNTAVGIFVENSTYGDFDTEILDQPGGIIQWASTGIKYRNSYKIVGRNLTGNALVGLEYEDAESQFDIYVDGGGGSSGVVLKRYGVPDEYDHDFDAAAGGIEIGQQYRTGNVIRTRIGTGTDGVGSGGGGGSVAWTDVTGKPATFTPSAHTHVIADVTNLQTTLDAKQPLDSDLTAIAALTTTSFGRGLLQSADAAALRTSAALGGAATLNVGTTAGTVAAGDDSRFSVYPDHPGYVVGNWYLPNESLSMLNGAVVTATAIRLIPIFIRQQITISDLGARVTTLSAGGLFGLAIYAANPTTKRPTGTPLASVMGLSTAVATTVSGTLSSNVSLAPGMYWGAVVADNGTVIFQSAGVANNIGAIFVGDTSLGSVLAGSTNGFSGLTTIGSYAGGFTDLTAASFTVTTNQGNAAVAIKIASVP